MINGSALTAGRFQSLPISTEAPLVLSMGTTQTELAEPDKALELGQIFELFVYKCSVCLAPDGLVYQITNGGELMASY